MSRAVVVVDLETSALRPTSWDDGGRISGYFGVVVEASWWNLSTGEHGTFIPPHSVGDVLEYGDPAALDVSQYRERIAPVAVQQMDDGRAWRRLHQQLSDNTLAGSNPTFEARFLAAAWAEGFDPEPWHHRLLDVSAYAAGALGLPGHELPGLSTVCERLGIDPPDHTAAGDVRAAGEALYLLGAVERAGGAQ